MQQCFIAVVGSKGGTGKTITAIHVAGFFATRKTALKTLLIDSDRNLSAVRWAGRGKLPFDVMRDKESFKVIKDYELIIVDTAPTSEAEDLNAIAKNSDLVILPSKPDGLSLTPTLMAYNFIETGINKKILICESPPNPAKDGQILQKSLRANNFQVFESMIRRSKGFGFAAEKGETIASIKHPSRVAWYDYCDLGKEIETMLNI